MTDNEVILPSHGLVRLLRVAVASGAKIVKGDGSEMKFIDGTDVTEEYLARLSQAVSDAARVSEACTGEDLDELERTTAPSLPA